MLTSRTRRGRFGLCLALVLSGAGELRADERLPESLLGVPSGVGHALLVDKEAEKLFLFEQYPDRPPRRLRVWNATTGQGSGDKTVEGDLKTPEGIYFFTEVLEDHELPARYGVRALVTDYPNLFDRRAGKTGDGIWVHGTDEFVRPLTSRRTRGCVVVTNRDMDELTPYVDLRSSPIVVEQHLRWLDGAEWRAQRDELHRFVATWQRAWSTSDFDTYRQLYSRRFRSDGKDRRRWLGHKRVVADATDHLDVVVVEPLIVRRGSEAIARFGQLYESDHIVDYGEKTLWLEREADRWQIVAETWRDAPVPPPLQARVEAHEPVRAVAAAAPVPPAPPVPSPASELPEPVEVVAGNETEPETGTEAPVAGVPRRELPRGVGDGIPAAGVAVATAGLPVASERTGRGGWDGSWVAPARVPGSSGPTESPLRWSVERFLAEAGEGQVLVNFRLWRDPKGMQPARGSVIIAVKVTTAAGDRHFAWPWGTRLINGEPAPPIVGDSFSIRRFKNVAARIEGLPRDAILRQVRVFVYDTRGRLVHRWSLGE